VRWVRYEPLLPHSRAAIRVQQMVGVRAGRRSKRWRRRSCEGCTASVSKSETWVLMLMLDGGRWTVDGGRWTAPASERRAARTVTYTGPVWIGPSARSLAGRMICADSVSAWVQLETQFSGGVGKPRGKRKETGESGESSQSLASTARSARPAESATRESRDRPMSGCRGDGWTGLAGCRYLDR